jgi:hypothetical protein
MLKHMHTHKHVIAHACDLTPYRDVYDEEPLCVCAPMLRSEQSLYGGGVPERMTRRRQTEVRTGLVGFMLLTCLLTIRCRVVLAPSHPCPLTRHHPRRMRLLPANLLCDPGPCVTRPITPGNLSLRKQASR